MFPDVTHQGQVLFITFQREADRGIEHRDRELQFNQRVDRYRLFQIHGEADHIVRKN